VLFYTFIISAILTIQPFGLESASLRQPVDQAAQPSTPPKVSDAFQPEVSQLVASGLKLKEAVEASLDGAADHLGAIFERAGAKEPSQRFEFRIFESDGQKSKTIFRRSDFFFTFANGSSKLNATDLNGDGLKEIIVQSSSGGNCWGCNPTEIYRVSNHKAELIAAGPIQQIVDLNKDGIADLLMTDARWESYDDLSHSASPGAVMVYAWRNGKYVYASRDFPDYYQAAIAELRNSIDQAKAEITADEFSDEAYVGRAIGLAITYAHAGELERGLKELETLLNSNAKTAAQKKHRATILEDFRSGESAKKLRAMKYGDELALG